MRKTKESNLRRTDLMAIEDAVRSTIASSHWTQIT
jgi:hypothetical protein